MTNMQKQLDELMSMSKKRDELIIRNSEKSLGKPEIEKVRKQIIKLNKKIIDKILSLGLRDEIITSYINKFTLISNHYMDISHLHLTSRYW